jgi:catechol 2,3-dioxygenase-like lactoylglutathione lyase family enzyme
MSHIGCILGSMRLALLLVGLAMARAPHQTVADREYAEGAPSTACASFHHLHLNDPRPSFLLNFYERLFDPATVTRVSSSGADGLKSGSMLMLISPAPEARPVTTAIWHFGWGQVSLGETYLAHARREVAWEPPLPAERLHLHLRSVNPSAAAEWYHDLLGARVESTSPSPVDDRLPPPASRLPEALVWMGETGLLIYRAEPPLLPTRGQRADHLAIGCRNLDAALTALHARGVIPVSQPGRSDAAPAAMIEGPDRIAIELVEIQ